MSEQITLSDVREWTDGRVGRIETALDCIMACKENERPLGLIQHLCNMYAILQKAPIECVQELDNEGWRETTSLAGCRPLRYTYRLHPDIELVDDTVEQKELTMELPKEISDRITDLWWTKYEALWAKDARGDYVRRMCIDVARLVAEDCAARLDSHQIAVEGESVERFNAIMRAVATDLRQRYGLDENNNERAAAWKPPVNGT